MGRISTFEIFLRNAGGVCHAGGLVEGQVFVEATKDVLMQEISIELESRSEVFCMSKAISEGQPGMSDRRADQELYINESFVLWERQDGLITKGSHLYDFKFQLPSYSPSSYEGEFGFVRYMLTAFAKKVWDEQTTQRIIPVMAKLDLNYVEHANEQIERAAEMIITSVFFQRGVCHCALRLDRQGFVPGEIIPLSYLVHNNTSVPVVASLELRMTIQYHGEMMEHTTKSRLQMIKYSKITPKSICEKRETGLRVPVCPPSYLDGCNLIDILYSIVLRVKPARLSFKRLRIPIKIVVGTVPLRRGSLLSAMAGSRPGEPLWTDMPPPSYEDAMDGVALRRRRRPAQDDPPRPAPLPDNMLIRPRANTESSIVRVQRR